MAGLFALLSFLGSKLMNDIEHNARVNDIIRSHTKLGGKKAVSYLPINSIATVLGITVERYCQIVEDDGNKAVEFGPTVCCIKSGAVFAYNENALTMILREHRELLSKNQWPLNADDFIRKISSEWLDDLDPVMPIVKEAFGD
jgi:hypothetical protein